MAFSFHRKIEFFDSSNISSMLYNIEDGSLMVSFKAKNEGGPDSIYHYYRVPKEVISKIVTAESPGSLFNKVKLNYSYKKVSK